MRGLHRYLLLFLLALAPDLLARVLSYAPYTSRPAKPSYHLRTGRWFALVESVSHEPWEETEVVLYDAQGLEEPRVAFDTKYDRQSQYQSIGLVAVHETPPGHFDPQTGPDILIAVYRNGIWQSLLSSDGGVSWQRIHALDHAMPDGPVYRDRAARSDYGGPFARGLYAPVSVGGAFPFVISTNRGTYGISPLGHATRLHRTGRLVGRDAEGTRFLIVTNNRLSIVDSRGHATDLGDTPSHNLAAGWITNGGEAYVQYDFGPDRRLFFHDPPRNPYLVAAGAASTRFFAVPTHDFGGAWLIQRSPGVSTTLARHTRVPGIEIMWRDASAPEVEALHAASGPGKLLVQVHRPRVQTAAQFLDPALAVWRMGEPAPVEYDELFLNEGPWKGFVHLDVDTIESGAPFVFDSAQFTEWFDSSPIASPAGPGGSDVMQEWGVVRGSLKQRLVLPAVARQAGAFGSFWLTDAVIYNPLDDAQRIDLRLLPIEAGPRIAAALTATLTLDPHEIRVVADVVKTLFGIEQGGGSILLEPEQAIAATSRTYTRSRGGTAGFGGGAIDFYSAASPRFDVYFGGALPGRGYRTNVFVTDTSGRGTDVDVRLHLWRDFEIPGLTFRAPPAGVVQTFELSSVMGLERHAGLSVRPSSGGGIVTVVAIDNRTNDATWFPPDLPAPDVRTIPMAQHIDLPDGRKIRTDLYLMHTGARPAYLDIEGRSWDATSAVRRTYAYLYPGEAHVIPDILGAMKMSGTARLRFESPLGIRATSRTYIVDDDGGTYGSLIPPLNGFQSVAAGEALEILGIVGSPTLRAGLHFVDLSNRRPGETVKATVTITDERNRRLDTFDVEWPSAGGTQLEDLFAARGIAVPHAALVRVEARSGLIGAFGTLTDTVTGDLTYLAAALSAKPK